MYSLGCLIHAVHKKGAPPFSNHGSLASMRDHVAHLPNIPTLGSLEPDLQSLLRLLLTRHPASRPTPATLPSQPFFNSLPISTLSFLDRATFATQGRADKISFLRGLTGVLPRFSVSLRARKILPSLVEEMKDPSLLPYLLPNVFAIAQDLSALAFQTQVLPALRPLFALTDPPANMLTLLEHLELLRTKTDKATFQTAVLPLVYNAFESEHTEVQERALKVVPGLCETIDYAEVQGVLFPRVAVSATDPLVSRLRAHSGDCSRSCSRRLAVFQSRSLHWRRSSLW
jgi:SCY1-like protein 2